MTFLRVWPGGGISLLVASHRRSWPWWCARVLADHAHDPAQRLKNLEWVEYMATNRTTGSRKAHVIWSIVRYFVDTCDICGKRGTYLSGDSGRCRAHRLIADVHVVRARARHEMRSRAIEANLDSISRRVKQLPRSATPAQRLMGHR